MIVVVGQEIGGLFRTCVGSLRLSSAKYAVKQWIALDCCADRRAPLRLGDPENQLRTSELEMNEPLFYYILATTFPTHPLNNCWHFV
jgi:hypothetical protein